MRIIGAILITLILISILASAKPLAVSPSSLLEYRETPISYLCLDNLSPISAIKIAEANPNLTKQPRWKMVDLGYLRSEDYKFSQPADDIAGLPDSLINFTEGVVEFPENITLNSTNISNITVINDTFVWWD